MGLLRNQNHVSSQRGLPVDDKGASSSLVSVTEPAAIQLYYWNAGTRTSDAGQVAGVVVEAKLTYDNIKNEAGYLQATYNDTSVAFTSTALTTEVEFPWNNAEVVDMSTGTARATAITAGFANGEYCIDYSNGMIYGVKTTTTTTLTSVSYIILQNQAGGTTIVASDINIDEVGGTDVSAKNAAFAEKPLGIGYEYEALGALTADGGTAGDKVPLKGDANGVLYVKQTDGTDTPTMITQDSAFGTVSVGTALFGKYQATPTTYNDNDAAPILLDVNGRIVLSVGFGQYAEDTAHTTGDIGNQILAVRNDTLVSLCDTDGDYSSLQVNASGALYTTLSTTTGAVVVTDDSAAPAAPEMMSIGGIYRAAPAVYTDGDYTVLQTDQSGYLQLANMSGFDSPIMSNGFATMLRAADFDGSAMGTAVDAEGDSVTPLASLVGIPYVTLVNEDGSDYAQIKGYDSGTDAIKGFEVSPLSSHYTNGAINVDTTNVAAAATYYPSATGFSMDSRKNFSLTGKYIDAHAVTTTLSVQGSNDEDSTNASWLDIQGQINGLASATAAIPTVTGTVAGVTGVAVVTGTICNLLTTAIAQTVKFTWDFDNLNYRFIRVVLTPGDASNTVILKGRTTY